MNPFLFLVPALFLAAGGAALWLLSRLAPASGSKRQARQREQPLAHELPYWSLFEDKGVGVAVNVGVTDGYSVALLVAVAVNEGCSVAVTVKVAVSLRKTASVAIGSAASHLPDI